MSETGMHLCYGDSWVYCDGDCVRCMKNKVSYSNTATTDIPKDSNHTKTNDID